MRIVSRNTLNEQKRWLINNSETAEGDHHGCSRWFCYRLIHTLFLIQNRHNRDPYCPFTISVICDIINQTKCLPTVAGTLEGKKETASKLNSVSETILQMARSYDDSASDTLAKKIEDESIKSFKEEVMNNLEDMQDNLLYDDILLNDDVILDRCYKILEEKGFKKGKSQ